MDQLSPLVSLTLGGVLGAVANVAIGDKSLVLPRLEGHKLHLGFVAQLVLAVGVAHAVDHDFQTAFFASICGTALIRYVKRRIEKAFDGEVVPGDGTH